MFMLIRNMTGILLTAALVPRPTAWTAFCTSNGTALKNDQHCFKLCTFCFVLNNKAFQLYVAFGLSWDGCLGCSVFQCCSIAEKLFYVSTLLATWTLPCFFRTICRCYISRMQEGRKELYGTAFSSKAPSKLSQRKWIFGGKGCRECCNYIYGNLELGRLQEFITHSHTVL